MGSNSAMGKCCEPEAKCTSNTMQCPDGEVLREKAELLNCQGATCDQATDATTCCEPVAICFTHGCGSTNVLRANSMTIGCKALKCTTADDEAQCCVSKGNCLSLKCPQGHLHLATAKDTPCVDELCEATDYTKCCGSKNQCKTMKCPTNYVLRVGSHDATCKSWECQEADEDDRDTCCDPVRMCSTHTCVSEKKIKKTDAAALFCANSQCNDAQCCDNKGTCDEEDCPAGYQKKLDASTLLCSDQHCKDSPIGICCSPEATCNTLVCPAG